MRVCAHPQRTRGRVGVEPRHVVGDGPTVSAPVRVTVRVRVRVRVRV